DVYPEATEWELQHFKGPIPRGEKSIDSKKGQVHFAVAANWSAGSDRHCRVVIGCLVLIHEAHYGRSSGLAAGAGDGFQRWSVEWFRKGRGFLERVETIAGNGALGKDHQFRRLPGGSANPVGYLVSVCFRLAELTIHLNACDAGLWHR